MLFISLRELKLNAKLYFCENNQKPYKSIHEKTAFKKKTKMLIYIRVVEETHNPWENKGTFTFYIKCE